MTVAVAIARDHFFDRVGDLVGERLRALLDLVCTTLRSVTKVICAFAHVFGD